MKKVVFIAIYNLTDMGLSGGDRIFLELIKQWHKKYNITLFCTEEALTVSRNNDVTGIHTISVGKKRNSSNPLSLDNLFIHSINRIVVGVWGAMKNRKHLNDADFIYSVSDFLPDVLPALYIKLTKPSVKWIAALYLFAPKPWGADNPYKASFTRWLTGLAYWFTQLFGYWLIRTFANYVVACNYVEQRKFIADGFPADKITTVYGGVNVSMVEKISTPKKIKYDGVFMARFHVQKSPISAVKVWEIVVKTKPDAKLAMIGNGPEEEAVRNYIRDKKLGKNIELFGFMDGVEKYKLLKSSRIFVHPAIYETGGMAAAEGMVSGLPVIAFDHEGYDYTYPKGIVRMTPTGDYNAFAKGFLNLLKDKKMYDHVKKDAVDLMRTSWDWSKRADTISALIERPIAK